MAAVGWKDSTFAIPSTRTGIVDFMLVFCCRWGKTDEKEVCIMRGLLSRRWSSEGAERVAG